MFLDHVGTLAHGKTMQEATCNCCQAYAPWVMYATSKIIPCHGETNHQQMCTSRSVCHSGDKYHAFGCLGGFWGKYMDILYKWNV